MGLGHEKRGWMGHAHHRRAGNRRNAVIALGSLKCRIRYRARRKAGTGLKEG